MLVPEPLFAWLRSAGAVEDFDVSPVDGGGYFMSASGVESALSGKMVARALSGMLARKDARKSGNGLAVLSQQEQAALGQVSVMSTRPSHNNLGGASERLYVWNLLSPIMARVGVPMSTDDKALIVAGDEEVAMSVLEDLRTKLPLGAPGSSRRKAPEGSNRADVRSSKAGNQPERKSSSKGRQEHGRDMRYAAYPDSEVGGGGGGRGAAGLPDIGGGVGMGRYQNGTPRSMYSQQQQQQQPMSWAQHQHQPNAYVQDNGFGQAPRGGGAYQPEAWGGGAGVGGAGGYNAYQHSHMRGAPASMGGGYQQVGDGIDGDGARGYGYGGGVGLALHRDMQHQSSHPPSHRTPLGSERESWGALPLEGAEPLMNHARRGSFQSEYGGRGGGRGGGGQGGSLGRTCVDFLASLLSQHAGVPQQQAVDMILEKGQHRLRSMLVDGEQESHGSFSSPFLQAVNWLEGVFAASQQLQQLLTGVDPGGLVVTLDTLAIGLASTNREVCLWSSRVLSRIAFDLNATGAQASIQVAYEWFAPRGTAGPLSTAIRAGQAHPSVDAALFPVYEQFCKGRLRDFFTVDLPSRLRGDGEYSTFASSSVASFCGTPGGKEALTGQGVLGYLVGHALQDACPPSSDAARSPALSLIFELWSAFPSEFPIACGKGGTPAWEALRAAMLSTAVTPLVAHHRGGASGASLKMSAHSVVFRLLARFIEIKSQNAAVAYKLIVTSLLENYQEQDLRGLIVAKLGSTLQENPRMPLALLIEPLMRRVRSDGYAEDDFDFYLILARHPRLEPAQALMIIDVMARIAMTDPASALTASVPLVELLSRFKEHDSIVDFVGRLGKLGMSIVTSAEGDGKNMSTRKLSVIDVLIKVAETGHMPYRLQLRPWVESATGAVAEAMPPAIANQVQRLWAIVNSDVAAQPKQQKQQQVKKASEAKKENVKVQQQQQQQQQQHDSARQHQPIDYPSADGKKAGMPGSAPQRPGPSASHDDVAGPQRIKKVKPAVAERYGGVDKSNDGSVLMSDESQLEPSPQKMSAAERRATNLARAKEQLEAKKQAILDARKKREGKDELPNVLTEEQVKTHMGRNLRAKRASSNPPGPRSVAGRAASDAGDVSAQSDSDERMSLPDQNRRTKPSVLMRPPSAKTRKREQEIAEIRKKRLSRLAKADHEQDLQRKREKELFDKARKQVELRMAELKAKSAAEPTPILDESAVSATSVGSHQKPAAPLRGAVSASIAKFDLNAAHPMALHKFDIDRHAYMWVRNPARKQNVEHILTVIEELFGAAVGDKKAAKIAENAATRKAQMSKAKAIGEGELQPPAAAAAAAAESRLTLEEIDLLSKSAIGDDYASKMLRRQALLKKKLAMYKEERRRTEIEKEEEDTRLKLAMEEEKKREREAEERRRAKIKEKLARYKEKMENERAKKLEEDELKDKVSKGERKRRIAEYMKNKKDDKAVSKVPQPPAPRKQALASGAGKDKVGSPSAPQRRGGVPNASKAKDKAKDEGLTKEDKEGPKDEKEGSGGNEAENEAAASESAAADEAGEAHVKEESGEKEEAKGGADQDMVAPDGKQETWEVEGASLDTSAVEAPAADAEADEAAGDGGGESAQAAVADEGGDATPADGEGEAAAADAGGEAGPEGGEDAAADAGGEAAAPADAEGEAA